MGKKRHSQDKLWITYKEMVQDWSGKDSNDTSNPNANAQLPFNYCSLSFLPVKQPVCTIDGSIFEKSILLPYIAKYNKHPITSSPISIRDIITLNFYKNTEGNYACPITLKVFTDTSKIIAIRETGNVYSYEAYEELNKKPKNYKDLLNDMQFDSKNVIVLHDPMTKHQLISSFAFLKHEEEVGYITQLIHDVPSEDGMASESGTNDINIPSNYASLITDYDKNTKDLDRKREIMNMINNKSQSLTNNNKLNANAISELESYTNRIHQLEQSILTAQSTLKEATVKVKEVFNMSTNCFIYYLKQTKQWDKHLQTHSSLTTNGKMALSLTSTGMDLNTQSSTFLPSDDEIRSIYLSKVKAKKAKGYICMKTSLGNMNIELHCDKAPIAAENFIELAQSGYYNDTVFHRLVKGFIIQGGDPSASGKGNGGESIYGRQFKNEYNDELGFDKKGVIAMANCGKDTNGSQFFITLSDKGEKRLDRRLYSIFGHVVGGCGVLDEIKAIECGDKGNERPNKEIRIIGIDVYHNPFREVISEMLYDDFKVKLGLKEEERQLQYYPTQQNIRDKIRSLFPNTDNNPEEIGKYLGRKREKDKGYYNDSSNQRIIQQLKAIEEQSTYNKPLKAKSELFKDW